MLFETYDSILAIISLITNAEPIYHCDTVNFATEPSYRKSEEQNIFVQFKSTNNNTKYENIYKETNKYAIHPTTTNNIN